MLVPILTFAYSRLLRFYNRYLPIVDRPLYGGLHEFLGSRYRGFCTVLVPVLEHTQGLLALKAIAASQVLGWPKRESNRIRLSTKRSGVPRTPCPQCILPPVPSLANFGSCPSVWILPLVPGPPPTASERGPPPGGGAGSQNLPEAVLSTPELNPNISTEAMSKPINRAALR